LQGRAGSPGCLFSPTSLAFLNMGFH
jgi:hypothetical protein